MQHCSLATSLIFFICFNSFKSFSLLHSILASKVFFTSSAPDSISFWYPNKTNAISDTYSFFILYVVESIPFISFSSWHKASIYLNVYLQYSPSLVSSTSNNCILTIFWFLILPNILFNLKLLIWSFAIEQLDKATISIIFTK